MTTAQPTVVRACAGSAGKTFLKNTLTIVVLLVFAIVAGGYN